MRFFTVLMICLITSCGQNSEREQDNINEAKPNVLKVDSNNLNTDQERLKQEFEAQRYFIWDIDFDNKAITKSADFSDANLSIDSIIKGLNLKYRDVPLKKINVSHDTLYTRILDSEYLAERMGSTGSAYYFAEAVINLTTVPGVNFVKMDFTEGSHASPGIFSRKNYSGFKVIE